MTDVGVTCIINYFDILSFQYQDSNCFASLSNKV